MVLKGSGTIADFERCAGRTERMLAITFDDVPLQQSVHEDDIAPPTLAKVNKKLLSGIAANEVRAVGFVNAKLLHCNTARGGCAILKMWLDAGIELGNHTFSHIIPETSSLDAYCADVVRGEELIRTLLAERGLSLRFFRHPQLHTGCSLQYKRALERFLRNRGYTVAPVTIKHQDWVFATAYAEAKAGRNVYLMRRISEAYLNHLTQAFEFFEKFSVELLGYELRQIFFLHVNQLNADYFDRVFALIQAREYKIISLEQALEDRAYLLSDDYVGTRGPSWLHRWALARGFKAEEEPREPAFIRQLFESASQKRSRVPPADRTLHA